MREELLEGGKGKGLLSCTLCNKSFMFEDNLAHHVQIHRTGKVSKASLSVKQLNVKDTKDCDVFNINESFGRNLYMKMGVKCERKKQSK